MKEAMKLADENEKKHNEAMAERNQEEKGFFEKIKDFFTKKTSYSDDGEGAKMYFADGNEFSEATFYDDF